MWVFVPKHMWLRSKESVASVFCILGPVMSLLGLLMPQEWNVLLKFMWFTLAAFDINCRFEDEKVPVRPVTISTLQCAFRSSACGKLFRGGKGRSWERWSFFAFFFFVWFVPLLTWYMFSGVSLESKYPISMQCSLGRRNSVCICLSWFLSLANPTFRPVTTEI